MSLVLDTSLAAAWCFADETTEATERLLDVVAAEGALVPSHFYLELANVLLLAERHGRISAREVETQLGLFKAFSLVADGETVAMAWGETMRVARRSKLALYDAAFLELALRTGSTLATLDQPQAAAARRAGLSVLP